MSNYYKKSVVLALTGIFLAGSILPFLALPVMASDPVNAGAFVFEDGMATWGSSVTIEPGQEFKISTYARNDSPDVQVTFVTMVDSVPQYSSYVTGSTFVLNNLGQWQAINDNGSFPFASGMTVTNDGILSPSESVQYKYSVKMPNFLPAGVTSASWSGPMLNFTDQTGNQTKGISENTSIQLVNVPQINSITVEQKTYQLGNTINFAVTGDAGKTAYVKFTTGTGEKTVTLTSTGTSYTGSYTVAAGDTISNTRARIYFENTAGIGSYRDAANDFSISAVAPVVTPPTTSGGGSTVSPSYTGGGSGSSAPLPTTTTGLFNSNGGTISLTLSSGTLVETTFANNTFSNNNDITLRLATAEEKKTAGPISSDTPFADENQFRLEGKLQGVDLTTFSKPYSIKIKLTPIQVASRNPEAYFITRYNSTTHQWTALTSTYSSDTKKITASTNEPCLFALAYNDKFVVQPIVTQPSIDTGFILGASTGIYPNGTLLKVKSNPAVWYIENNQRHLIPNPQVFQNRFNWKDVIELPNDKELNAYDRGDNLNFMAGTLIKSTAESTIYRVSSTGSLQPIKSEAVFLDRNYSYKSVITVSTETINALNKESAITDIDTLYEGDLVKAPTSVTVWRIGKNEEAMSFPNKDIFSAYKYNFNKVWTIARSRMEQIFNRVGEMNYPDGTLVKGTGKTVYVISDNTKRPFISDKIFTSMLYKWKNIKRVSDKYLANIPDGKAISTTLTW